MTSRSGASGQVIAAPTGGGAVQGIGEKFSPDLFTGTGNFTVPITLPPGRNGFQPQLNLVYSSGNGNGPFGLGWNLSIPGVSRKTSQGIPRYDDRDVFILSGAEDLVPVEPDGSARQYRPRTEGLFARIIHHHDPARGDDYWEVRGKDGLVSLYGTPGAAGKDPAVIADPDQRTKPFAWKLAETRDPFGNRIVYEYERDTGQQGPHHWDQLYLKHIRYVDYTDPEGQERFLVSVTLHYEELADHYANDVADTERIYPFSDYRAGFEIRTRKRCTAISVSTHGDQDHRVRTYHLTYLDQVADPKSLPLNGLSLLHQLRVEGHDDAAQPPSEELPPLEFDYTRFDRNRRKLRALTGDQLPVTSLANPDFELVDLFGQGRPDILEFGNTVRYWRNLGEGRFARPHTMATAPAGVRLADAGVQIIDADGDGRADLLVTREPLSGYYPMRFGGLWDERSFQRYRNAPSFNLEDPEVRLVDLTGDGVTDALRSGTRFECFFNDPQLGWQETRQVKRGDLAHFPNVNFSDPRVKWADMTGDGLQDIVLVHDRRVDYWPNLGYGRWGERVTLRNGPHFPHGYDPKRILIGDVDGDGVADLLYVDNGQVTLWINQSGNGFADPIVIRGTPAVTDLDSVRLVDLLGNGVAGVLWSAEAGVGWRRRHLFFLDFTGGIKPYLLHEMNNHMGAITRVEYAASTEFELDDQKHPNTRWKTPLPFPVQVVRRVEVIDELSQGKLTTEYRYHHGYWDGVEREFRGFGRVDHYDTEVFDRYHDAGLHGEDRRFAPVRQAQFSPPTLTKTWFHQGPIVDPGTGAWDETDFSPEFWAEDPQVSGPARGQAGADRRPAPAGREVGSPGRARRVPRAARHDHPHRTVRAGWLGPPGAALHRHRIAPRRARGSQSGSRAWRAAPLLPAPARPAHHPVGARRRADDPVQLHRRL